MVRPKKSNKGKMVTVPVRMEKTLRDSFDKKLKEVHIENRSFGIRMLVAIHCAEPETFRDLLRKNLKLFKKPNGGKLNG